MNAILGARPGPILAAGEKPWPTCWEQDPSIDDGHPHEWEVCLCRIDRRPELVVRCASCHVPRCGHSIDADPCMERRHHRGYHLTYYGLVGFVGGLMPRA